MFSEMHLRKRDIEDQIRRNDATIQHLERLLKVSAYDDDGCKYTEDDIRRYSFADDIIEAAIKGLTDRNALLEKENNLLSLDE